MIPELAEIFNFKLAPKFNFPPGTKLGAILSQAFNLVLFTASFLLFFWLVWGIFQYIFASGNKEGLAKARSRMIWAIVGFIIVILAFTISNLVQEIFPPQKNLDIKTIKTP